MALRIGIVGLPNVGKSTLFNVLTKSRGAQTANYPFCTIEPNVGIVAVPDPRLQNLATLVMPEKIVPASIEFVDIAGLVRGASKGEGLGNKFLAAIREVDALCHVVRLFTGGNIIHVEGSVHPQRDREIIETELILADLDAVERRLERIRNAARTGDKEKQRECTACEKIATVLRSGKLAKEAALLPEEENVARTFSLLTDKTVLYAANVAEADLKTVTSRKAQEAIGVDASVEVVPISCKIEEDLQDLSAGDAAAFLRELGVQSSGLDRLIRAAYDALGYITYFTAGPKEVRAWNVPRGAKAPQAAGVIHTDFEKGFIRAEAIGYDDFVTAGSEAAAREAGKLRIEGKDYVVKDGDILHFRFNV